MGRPVDWSPLAGSDPVPGDPAAISAEAARLSSVAQQIAGQVALLRKIAGGQSDEKGEHAVKLQSAASDTAGHMDKVTGRYRETSAALTAWVPELEHAQAQSLKALSQAQEAHGRQRANQPIQRQPGAHLTAADHQEDKARSNALSQANADMASAQAMLAAAVSQRDQAASRTVSKIRSAISADADAWYDGITGFFSSAWDWVKDHWVPLLKDFCTALEIIATVLAFIALFIPGLNIVAALAIITLIALLGRTALAVTGNGSWLDVGLDVLALATMGLAGAFGRGLATAAKGAMETGEGMVTAERASTAAEYMTKFFGSTHGSLIGEGRATEVVTKWAAEDVPGLPTEAENMGYFAKVWSGIKAGGDLEDAENAFKIGAARARFGGVSPEIADAAVKGSRALLGLRASAVTSWGGAVSGLVGGGGEMDNAHGDAAFRVTIPGVSHLWDNWESGATKAVWPQFKMATGG